MAEHVLGIQISAAILFMGLLGWWILHQWYFGLVSKAQSRVRHIDGKPVPSKSPKFLMGHLTEVYQSDNRLAAYHRFHEQLGEIVQIFWLWRPQVSITNRRAVHQILVTHQQNYRKFPPNSLIQRLYGASILTNHGREWQRQRALMQGIFSPKQVSSFHSIFVSCTEKLVSQWLKQDLVSEEQFQRDIYPDLTELFLDIISQAAFGIQVNALQGEMNEVLASICLILDYSTHPLYQFIPWWQYLPLSKNKKLNQAFLTVDTFLYSLIQKHREATKGNINKRESLLTLLMLKTHEDEEFLPLSDQEIRDNLLAITINGYETVATSVAFSLNLLAQHPKYMNLVQVEVDNIFAKQPPAPSQLAQLPYLCAVIVESLRLYPPMAGLQRISIKSDQLDTWSIPDEQVVGIPLRLLHIDPQQFGDCPEQFRPERYWDSGRTAFPQARGCPIKRFLGQHVNDSVQLPLTFGDGARRCLGETFALDEMAIALGILLHHFNFSIQPGDGAEMELGKFGLFISMKPKQGACLTISKRRQDKISDKQGL